MKRSALLLSLALPLAAQVAIRLQDSRATVEIGGKPFTTVFMGPEFNKPFLSPLRAADGAIVTRGYPMEPREGERRDHPHQRGCWFSHGDVNGYDFWANEKSQWGPKKGRIVLTKRPVRIDGGALTAVFDWQDNAGAALLTETRTIVFHDDPNLRIIDFDIRLAPVVKVTFGDTKEGTFAMRLAASLEEPVKDSPAAPKRTGLMVNAEGLKGEREVWGKRSNWVDYAGEVDGEKLGIAILDHPENPRHPTWWHSRSYGLFAANPFGEHDFENDKDHPEKGALTLEPGQEARFRYRVIIHSGDARSADISGQYAKFAK
jgi:hypothetical protein